MKEKKETVTHTKEGDIVMNFEDPSIQWKRIMPESKCELPEIELKCGEPLIDLRTGKLYVGGINGNKICINP